MKWFHNLKIRTKLLITFFILALFTGAVGILAIMNLKVMNDRSHNMYNEDLLPIQDLKNIQVSLQQIRALHVYLLYDTDSSKVQSRIDSISSAEEQVIQSLVSYENYQLDKTERDLLQAVKDSMAAYDTVRTTNIDLIKNGQRDKAIETIQVVTDARDKSDKDLQKLVDFNQTNANNNVLGDEKNYKNISMLMNFIIIAAVSIAIFLGFYVSAIISKPVKRLVEAANNLALGNVDVDVKADSRDEIGSLSEAFRKMIENIRGQAFAAEKIASGDLSVDVTIKSDKDLLGRKLSEMVENNNEVLSNIASAAEQVAAGAKQVSDSSMALSQGATEQASSIEELTASLEEISSQTKLNAQNANQANELAENAKSNAVQGNEQMKEMLKAMEEINESSANISKIIKVIDDIAFQTNILALNAAVEAARAGQHGKGFAVVAEEVRNLAARSANAAKETTEMIEGSIKKAEGGTRIARDTAGALGRIVTEVEKVANLVNDIAVASNEQASGIGQINQGIMQVSQVVQSNSATSEESAAASEELSSQAEIMKDLISRFKLRKNSRSFDRIDDLSPEVMAMLENMADKKRKSVPEEKKEVKPKGAKPKIVLSDREFGKY